MKMFKCLVVLLALLAGYESRRLSSRVVGGFEPIPHQFPFLISVTWEFPPLIPERHICGGVIVSPDWVLTAASCIPKTGKLSVKSGKHNLAVYEPGEEVREVQMSVIHKDYRKSSLLHRIPRNNVALLKLKFPLSLNNSLFNFDNTGKTHTGEATLVGWGEGNKIGDLPQAATAPLLPWDSCQEVLKINYKNVKLEDTQICTGPIGGEISACSGDIGGPLVQYNDHSKPELIGVVSWTSKPCGKDGLPTIYTYIPDYIEWINDKLEASK